MPTIKEAAKHLEVAKSLAYRMFHIGMIQRYRAE
jgi:hypothetical protein